LVAICVGSMRSIGWIGNGYEGHYQTFGFLGAGALAW
jgi:hypothetical protein